MIDVQCVMHLSELPESLVLLCAMLCLRPGIRQMLGAFPFALSSESTKQIILLYGYPYLLIDTYSRERSDLVARARTCERDAFSRMKSGARCLATNHPAKPSAA